MSEKGAEAGGNEDKKKKKRSEQADKKKIEGWMQGRRNGGNEGE